MLQEEGSVKPEEQGPRSRLASSTEDMTSASKQVDYPDLDIWVSYILENHGYYGLISATFMSPQ